MRWSGKLEHRDLEGGVWTLHTPQGAFTLYGDVPRDLAGAQVVVEGDSEDGGFGFGIAMTGPSITVRQVRKA